MDGPKTLLEAIRYFADEDNCFKVLLGIRFPDGVVPCPTCGGTNHYFLGSRKTWKCKVCKRQFSIKVGTVFEDSPISLSKWLPTIWMICGAKNGISSYEVHRAIGVTQKTAWFMLHRIRLAMQEGTFEKLGDEFGGEVEADETLLGGKEMNKHYWKRHGRRGAYGKIAVMGFLERGGKVRTEVISQTNKITMQPLVRKHVEPGSYLYTDSHGGYRGMPEYVHKFVDHMYTYAVGRVHTNGMENFWSLLKRTIRGTYVSVEPYHLYSYLDEQAFRFNQRKGTDAQRFALALSQVSGRRVTYNELIGKTCGA
jgi:transposase-like protein